MFITSVKAAAVRNGAIIFAIGVILAVILWPRNSEAAVQAAAGPRYTGISTNEKRVGFIESFGWKVEPEPIEVVEVTIPQMFNKVYQNYNAIQKKQNLNLEKFKGRRVKRWTYKITNYPNVTGDVRANLLIYNNEIIGGDVSTVALNGFMHGFSPKSASDTGTVTTPQSADITTGLFSATSQN